MRTLLIVGMLLAGLSTTQVGWACGDYEVCLFRTEIGNKYGTFDSSGTAHSAYNNKPLSKEQAQVNVLKAIAYKLDEIVHKLTMIHNNQVCITDEDGLCASLKPRLSNP